MALYIVGEFIKETRMRKGYTQEELSFGICTPASLSRIENGVQMPGRFTLEKLLERLGIENSLFNIFVSREEMELYETVQTMIRNITDLSCRKMLVDFYIENITGRKNYVCDARLIFGEFRKEN